MAVLIDPPLWPAHGHLWSHLVSDLSLEELHAFARAAGVPERGFEGDHYDVPEARYQQLVAGGAEPVGTRELLLRLQRSGLRRPKRRGERVIASSVTDDGRRRLDTVRSALVPPSPVTAVTLVVCGAEGVLWEVSSNGPPRLVPVTDDLSAATGFGSRLLGTGLLLEWSRVGYVRSAPSDASEPSASYHSVLAARCRQGDSAILVAPHGHRWLPEREAVAALAPEIAPLVESALGQERP